MAANLQTKPTNLACEAVMPWICALDFGCCSKAKACCCLQPLWL